MYTIRYIVRILIAVLAVYLLYRLAGKYIPFLLDKAEAGMRNAWNLLKDTFEKLRDFFKEWKSSDLIVLTRSLFYSL